VVRSASGKFLTPGVGRYTLHLLGTVSLEGPDGPLSGYPVQRRQLALLAILAVSWRDGITRDKVLAHLWPETAPHSARHSLADALYRLRKELGQDVILGRSTNLRLNPDLIHVDLVEFEKAVDAHDLDTAAGLDAGPFLDGFHLGGSGEFDVWKDGEARRLAERRDTVLDALARRAEEEGDFARAAHWLRRLLASDPYNSGTVIRLMEVQAAGGDPGNAVKLAAEHAALLARDLTLEPPPELVALAGQLHGKRSGAEVPAHPIPLPFVAPAGAPAAAPAPDFVGRDAELARLHQFLEGALGGNGQVVFITGEAGTGKTALADEFCRRALEVNPDLVIANGNCNAYTGHGDPYLPFRELLSLLSGGIEARYAASDLGPDQASRLWQLLPLTARGLATSAPDLLDTFLSRAELEARLRLGAADPAWLAACGAIAAPEGATSRAAPDSRALFDQYVRLLKSLAHEKPLLLVLDDLQWADSGSVGLLFQLGRQLAGSRILLLGLYRPSDVAAGRDGGRHPLEAVLNELRATYGVADVALDEQGTREFVDALVDLEPNVLDAPFRDAVYRLTRGHALFTVELLRAMRERGALVRKAGTWRAAPDIDWSRMPTRIRATLAERIGRLPEAFQRMLSVASAEGELFTLEVVAEVLRLPAEEALAAISGQLERRAGLVQAHGIHYLDGRRLSTFRFRHILIQSYLYDTLDAVERAHWHGQIGTALERAYGDHSAGIAPQLSHHFREAGVVEKALTYLAMAGTRARDMGAFPESAGHFQAALEVLQALPASKERDRQELELELGLANAIHSLAQPEFKPAVSRAYGLAARVGSREQLFSALYLKYYAFAHYDADNRLGRTLSEEALGLARESGDQRLLVHALEINGRNAYLRGDLPLALARYQELASIYQPSAHRNPWFDSVFDIGPATAGVTGMIHWTMGSPDQALKCCQDAVAQAEALASTPTLLFMQLYLGWVRMWRGELQEARQLYGCIRARVDELGLGAYYTPMLDVYDGWCAVELEEDTGPLDAMQRAFVVWRATGWKVWVPYCATLLARALSRFGRADEGLAALRQAHTASQGGDDLTFEAEIHRTFGALHLGLRHPRPDEAERCFRHAIEVARGQEAKSFELRAATSLARLLQTQGRAEEARPMLSEIYGWFTEGFDTADLMEAKAVLGRLG
jgi:DNA-binding SARP family transcriptional activator